MTIATEDSANKFLNIVAATPLNNSFPLFEEDEIEVVYGAQALIAVYPTDYTVTLSPPNYNSFTVTPTASLITKINNLIATPPTTEPESNFVVIRRRLDYLTSVEPETVRYTPFLSKEIDRIHMKLIQLAERVARNLGLPSNVVGELTDNYTISAPVEGKAPVWRGNKLVAEIDAANIAAAQGYSVSAAASAALGLGYRDETQILRDQAVAAASGMKRKTPVRARTTAALPSSTYNNGTLGVGATLTATANGALAAQDGVTLLAGEGLLVGNQASSQHNGLYLVTQVGSGGTPWILTRQTDSDTWNEIVAAVVTVMEGTANADLDFLCTSNLGGTMGTTAITWQAYSSLLADGAVSSTAKLADNIVSTNKIINDAVTTAKILDGNVTFAKLAAAALGVLSDLVAGTANKLVTAAVLRSFVPAPTTYTLAAATSQIIPLNANCNEADIDFHDLRPSTTGVTIYLSICVDGTGTNFIETGSTHRYSRSSFNQGGAFIHETSGGSDFMTFRLGATDYVSNLDNEGLSGRMRIHYRSGEKFRGEFNFSAGQSGTAGRMGYLHGVFSQDSTTKATHLKVSSSAGTLTGVIVHTPVAKE